jgi:hypothetical protein
VTDERRIQGHPLVHRGRQSAALYAYAAARNRDVLCLAHVTDTMAVAGDDLEKGHANGAVAALAVTAAIASVLQA